MKLSREALEIIFELLNTEYNQVRAMELHLIYQQSLPNHFQVVELNEDEIKDQIHQLYCRGMELTSALQEIKNYEHELYLCPKKRKDTDL